MVEKRIPDMTLAEIENEIDEIVNFEINGGGYGALEAREAYKLRLEELRYYRNQKSKIEVTRINPLQEPARNYLDDVNLYVNPDRLLEIEKITAQEFDLSKLIRLCEELNICDTNDCCFAMAMLTRTILDHVPPIFKCKNFAEIANNYAGTRSFKKSMKHLQESSRNISDAHLHGQIRDKETLPNKTQVNFSNDLDVLLAEIVRILK